MRSVLVNWIVPGLRTLAVGAALICVGATASSATGAASPAPWASGVTAGKDAAGTRFVAQAATPVATAGIAVTTDLPRVSPYWFMATLSGGKVALDGYVPDVATRERLTATGIDGKSLELADGAPARFDAAVAFGLNVLGHLGEGRFTVRENVVTIKGRARTGSDLAAIDALVGQGAPDGLIMAMADIRPPVAAIYVWSAQKSGESINITGFAPDAPTRTALAAAAGTITTDASAIADGAPDGFSQSATTGLGILAQLDGGTLKYDGKAWSLSGTATTPQQAFDAESAFRTAGLAAAGWTYDVKLPAAAPVAAAPAITPYAWSAEKLPAGTVSFAGHVPTAALQRFLTAHAGGKTVDNSAVGSGAPSDFATAALAGLDAVLALEEGKVSFDGTKWSLTGRTPDADRAATLTAALGESVDTSDWRIEIASPPPAPPVADPYTWSVAKAPDGTLTLSGHVPNDGFKRFLAAHAEKVASDSTDIASGEPEGFAADVLAALAALDHLSEGNVGYDGTTWFISGKSATAASADATVAALSSARTSADAWRKDIAAPPAPERVAAAADGALPAPAPLEPPAIAAEAPEPATAVVEPAPTPPAAEATAVASVAAPPATPAVGAPPSPAFIFDATRADGGPVALKGVVPADAARRWFGVIAGNVPTDAVQVASNLPPTFIPNADAGVRALTQLTDGTLGYDGSHWSLTGTADTVAARDAVVASITALPDAASWTTDVTLTPPIALCRREVADFEGNNKILFQSGKAKMTDASAKSLAALADYLASCPDVTVEVEGHTDADGPDDLNLALSVSRAEAVVDGLIANGIAAERLYAIGYGESVPIASNDTAAGKQANRRIVFTLVEGIPPQP